MPNAGKGSGHPSPGRSARTLGAAPPLACLLRSPSQCRSVSVKTRIPIPPTARPATAHLTTEPARHRRVNRRLARRGRAGKARSLPAVGGGHVSQDRALQRCALQCRPVGGRLFDKRALRVSVVQAVIPGSGASGLAGPPTYPPSFLMMCFARRSLISLCRGTGWDVLVRDWRTSRASRRDGSGRTPRRGVS